MGACVVSVFWGGGGTMGHGSALDGTTVGIMFPTDHCVCIPLIVSFWVRHQLQPQMVDSDDELDRIGAEIDRELRRRCQARERRTLTQLSPELLFHILSFTTAYDLLTIASVSRGFHSACGHCKLWGALFHSRWSVPQGPGSKYPGPECYFRNPTTLRLPHDAANAGGGSTSSAGASSSSCSSPKGSGTWKQRYVWRLHCEHAWMRQGHHQYVLLPGSALHCEFLAEDWAVSCGSDGGVTMWDAQLHRRCAVLQGHTAPVFSSSYDATSEWLATAGADECLCVWDPVALQLVSRIQCPGTEVVWQVLCQGQILICASGSGTVQLYDARTGEVARVLVGHSGDIFAVQCASPGLYSAGTDNTLRMWDVGTGKRVCEVPDAHWGSVFGLCLTPEAALVSAAGDATVKIWDAARGALTHVATCDGHQDAVLAVQADEYKVVSGSKDQHVNIWDLSSGRLLNSFTDHPEAVFCLGFGGSRMLTGGNSALTLWDFAD